MSANRIYRPLIFAFVFLFPFFSKAQLTGYVYGSSKDKPELLLGAILRLKHAGISQLTNEKGYFELILPKELPDTLIVSFPGYFSDSILVNSAFRFKDTLFVLIPENKIEEVVIVGGKKGHQIDKLKTLAVEEINSGELRKAACCNLSESFETNASVDVNISDAVTGTKRIQVLGLDGVYTQIQFENIPYLRGLESAFGMNAIPGTWLQSIQITKGTGTVVNGYESMAGLINLEFKKPATIERFYFNYYSNIFGRNELNLHAGHHFSEKWSTALFVHGAGVIYEMDRNNDGFRDMPLGQTFSAFNRWQYKGERVESQFGVNMYSDRKIGGQMGFEPSKSASLYGLDIDSKHIDLFSKTGILFPKKPYQSIGIISDLKQQQLVANYGLRTFNGLERRAYLNAIFDGIIGSTDHKFRIGISVIYLEMHQKVDTFQQNRTEIVPGCFYEYTYSSNRMSLVAGTRLDYHNLFGWQFVPRIHAKYSLTERLDFRLTAGKGWRVPNFTIDNLALLATSRQWVMQQSLQPEISWNMGGSVVQEMMFFKRKSSIVLDYYYTFFQNQLIVDRDESVNQIIFRNFTDRSSAQTIQLEWSFEPIKRLELRIAYKNLSVQARYADQVQQQVMIPKHRFLFTENYKSRNKRWEISFTASVYGKMRLPENNLHQSVYSPAYTLINAQVTHIYKRWNFYIGGENLTNFKQRNPIIDAQNPFGSTFDATQVWGPIMGLNAYVGVRYSLKNTTTK